MINLNLAAKDSLLPNLTQVRLWCDIGFLYQRQNKVRTRKLGFNFFQSILKPQFNIFNSNKRKLLFRIHEQKGKYNTGINRN